MGKKRKKQRQQEAWGQGYGMPGYGEWNGGEAGHNGYGRMDAGFLQGLPGILKSRQSEQFLLGALIGAGAAWVLADEELRGKIIKAGMKLYAGIAGGFEEMKEQMADIRAEVETEAQGE